MLKYSVEKSSGSEHDPPRHGKTRHDMNQIESFRGMRETVWTLHTGGTRGPSAESEGLTATEDDVQLLVRHVCAPCAGGWKEEVLDRDKRDKRNLVVKKVEV